MKLMTQLIPAALVTLLQLVAVADPSVLESPQVTYQRLTDEFNVQLSSANGPIVGSAINQKNNPAGQPAFCRQVSAVVPNPTYSYACYDLKVTGEQAKAIYIASAAQELHAQFRSRENGGILVGSSWTEKSLAESKLNLCVKTAPVVPNPVATYSCYAKVKGIGGAVSGGN